MLKEKRWLFLREYMESFNFTHPEQGTLKSQAEGISPQS